VIGTPTQLGGDIGVFAPDQTAEFDAFYREYGFATFRGLLDDATVAAMIAEGEAAQAGCIDQTLPEKHGRPKFLELGQESKAEVFANYVQFFTEIAPVTRAAVLHPGVVAAMRRLLGDDCWLLEERRSGVVYQDARPGRESGYTRIGWHSDWQSAPAQPIWPSTAFTLHLDGTSPANGFLRVVPGSHRWATPAPYENVNGAQVPEGAAEWGGYTSEPPPFRMPLGFDKVPGEIALYLEAGDVLLHDAYLWHSAARATEDVALRRHVRGGWFTGSPIGEDGIEEFVKNAAR
jgi:ectoine hydroxylase-related dioxygenase (phytanoyl-CoA dioxygenase family)